MFSLFLNAQQVKPEKINLIIGSGGKKVKRIIEDTGVEAIDAQDDGTVSQYTTLSSNFYFSWHFLIFF